MTLTASDDQAVARRLRNRIESLCLIGPRASSVWHGGAGRDMTTLDAARDWLVDQLGGWYVEAQPFETPDGDVSNLEVRHSDAPPEPVGPVLLAGAHYDTWRETPGADDNASAVATLLHMLDELRDEEAVAEGRARFVLYANEEPPNFRTPFMGSLHHARSCRRRGWDVEMLCLESLGYYSDERGSQKDPSADLDPAVFRGLALPDGGLLGDVGNFLAFEADLDSSDLLRRLLAGYDAADAQPLRRIAHPLPQDLCTGLSDHWSYWRAGYPAVMVTDTALFRNPNYHKPSDLPDSLDYNRLTAAATRLTSAVVTAAQVSGGG